MKSFSLTDAIKVIHELTLAFGQPYGLSAAASEDLAKQWARVLDDCAPADVLTAVDQHIKREKKWPTASKIRDDSLKLEAGRKHKSTHVDGEFCPLCHAKDLISTGQHQRFMPFHAENCPGLHEHDRALIRAAIDGGNPVWRNGKPPTDQTTTAERLAKHQNRQLEAMPV